MEKKYIVRLTDEERETLRGVMKKLKGSSQQVRRAQMLLKADANGPNWTEKKIADAFWCRTKTVDNVRQRLVTVGVEIALHGEKPQTPPHQKRLDGEQEAQVIALRLGKPPQGFAHWSLRLLAEQVVELAIVDTVSHETLRKTRKKMAGHRARCSTGSSPRKPTAHVSRAWKTCWRRTRSLMTLGFRWCAWTNNRCNC